MNSTRTMRIVITIALLAHGIAHAIASIALLRQMISGPSADVVTVQSWLFPSLEPNLAATVAFPFWLVSALGFLGAAVLFWENGIQDVMWRRMAVVAAVISTAGIFIFSAIWPGTQEDVRLLIHPVVAMIMNIAVLVTQIWLHWPPRREAFGS